METNKLQLTDLQEQELLKGFVTTLAFNDGLPLKEEYELEPDDPKMIKYREISKHLIWVVKFILFE